MINNEVAIVNTVSYHMEINKEILKLFTNISWQETLNFVKQFSPEFATEYMKKSFPGPYKLQQRYDNCYYYTMEWEDEKDKIFWLLKYS